MSGDRTIVGFTNNGNTLYAVMENGDVWGKDVACCEPLNWGNPGNPWSFGGNLFGSGTLSVDPSTMGKVKGKYKDEEDE